MFWLKFIQENYLFFLYLQELENYSISKGTIVGYPKATAADANLLFEKCDILIPAATEQVITAENADKVQAKVRII